MAYISYSDQRDANIKEVSVTMSGNNAGLYKMMTGAEYALDGLLAREKELYKWMKKLAEEEPTAFREKASERVLGYIRDCPNRGEEWSDHAMYQIMCDMALRLRKK